MNTGIKCYLWDKEQVVRIGLHLQGGGDIGLLCNYQWIMQLFIDICC